MVHSYKQLSQYKISQDAIFNRRGHNRPAKVALANPATAVMSDLSATLAFTIGADASIEAANNKMIACGVRLLFVTEDDGSIAGLVTAVDVLGEKPVQYITQHGGKRSDILAKDIMTPKNQLEVMKMSDVLLSTVGDIVETIKSNRRQHLLVVESNEDGTQESIRGVFSMSQIGRQIGLVVEPSDRAKTFAELEKVLVSG